jgi:glycosyltransferase involved in cell wall biosynthesis
MTRKPHIVVLHGGNLPNLLSSSPRWLRKILRGADRVVSPSNYLASAFAEHARVEIIPNALSLKSYPFRSRPPVRPNFLYLRAFHRNYGPLTAIKAFSIVQRQYPEARLTMAGPQIDGVLEECRSLIAQLNLQPHVNLLGRVPKSQIPELGRQCDIFLNPTFVDNTPVSTVEAMAMGMCIVATTAGGLTHLLKDGETALLVKPGDDNQMADAMLKILAEPKLSARLSRNGRQAAEAMDWSVVLPRWSSLIESVAR